jgi:hypothetical protein
MMALAVMIMTNIEGPFQGCEHSRFKIIMDKLTQSIHRRDSKFNDLLSKEAQEQRVTYLVVAVPRGSKTHPSVATPT